MLKGGMLEITEYKHPTWMLFTENDLLLYWGKGLRVSPYTCLKESFLPGMWWHPPVVPVTWAAEVGGSLEPTSQAENSL